MITLPSDWRSYTSLQPESEIEELELVTTYGGSTCDDSGGSGSRRGSLDGGEDDEDGPAGTNGTAAAESAADGGDGDGDDDKASFVSSHRPGVTRTVRLDSYANGELPLQNVDHRGKLVGKSDMADLPFLHEAAILYNLKERHGRGVPYTRVGDIVVAMNPFRWIDGLYSEGKRNFYSEHLIWNAEGEKKDGGEDGGAKGVTAVESKSYKSEFDRLGYDPHVYETSCLAYRGLAIDKRDQTILVSGESGAGKTETVKIVMSHLATVERTRPFYESADRREGAADGHGGEGGGGGGGGGATSTVRRVLESNPVFEAFGNAKTVRNDNSSRFGKFTRLQFDVEGSTSARAAGRDVPACLLAGSAVTTYLLEKSRVVGHSPGERTYHIFYQLLAAPDGVKAEIWDGLGGTGPETFACVGETDTDAIEGHTDAEGWERTVEALRVFGVEGDELREMMRALCVVMQLGNLTFDVDPDAEDHEHERTVISSADDLELLANVWGVDVEEIEQAMTCRVMKMRGEEIRSFLTPGDARDGCDALAKDLYARTFDLLVRKINDYTAAEKNYVPPKTAPGVGQGSHAKRTKFAQICLLDIFGFERFDINRFEQLCINYANERLQHQYVLDNFNAVKEEYEAEGIEIFDFSKVDNSGVLDLLEGKMGLIISLNEECKRPKGNDASFVYKVKMVHTDSKHLIQGPLDLPTHFGVKHFAGAVSYDASSFVVRNTDKLPHDLLECACKSTNKIIQEEFQELSSSVQDAMSGAPRRGGVTTKHTVMTTFKSQLSSLMATIEKTQTRYIRCIKPNPQMEPGITNHLTTMTQLECAGLVTAIAISRESFPNRLTYEVIMDRFKCLIPSGEMQHSKALRDDVDFLLVKLLCVTTRQDMPYALGKTKVYFRAGALERLENIRLEYFSARAIVLQSWARSVIAQWRYREMRRAALVLQTNYRGYVAASKYRAMQKAVLVLQCATRCAMAAWEVIWRREDRAVTTIQTRWRMREHRQQYLKSRRAVRIIQRAVRGKKDQSKFTAKLTEFVEKARMDNKLSVLQEQVNKPAGRSRKQMDETMMEEIETMFDYLRKEIDELRKENYELKVEIDDLEDDNRELLKHVQSAEASAQVAQRGLGQLEKTNDTLTAEAKAHKKEMSQLKKQLKVLEDSHEENAVGMRDELEKAVESRNIEIKKLKGDLKASRRALKMEREMLTDEVERVQEEHLSEIMRLKAELKKTQDSHHDYLAKLMDVLETTHAAREAETARINDELETVRDEKDVEIESLKKEIKKLRSSQQANTRPQSERSESELKKQAMEATVMREEVNSHAVARMERAQKFRELSEALENEMSKESSSKREVSRSLIGRKSRKSGGSSDAIEVSRMHQMLYSLQDLYRTEEESHANVQGETLKMVERVGKPQSESVARNMQKALRITRKENEALKEQLAAAHGSCSACGYRAGSERRLDTSQTGSMRSSARSSRRIPRKTIGRIPATEEDPSRQEKDRRKQRDGYRL